MNDRPEDRDPVEMLAEEFTERLRRGERPSVAEYAARHPESADEIRELFPTIAAMERLKSHRESASSGRVALSAPVPDRLGDYRILREIGRGGMGIVYEARQESLRRLVAVKVLPKLSLLHPKHLGRFQREAQTAAGLHHTNIVPVFGVGQHDGFHFIVMQRIEGVGLDELLARLRRRSPEGPAGRTSPPPAGRLEDAACALVREKFPPGDKDDAAVRGSGDTEPVGEETQILGGAAALSSSESRRLPHAGGMRRARSHWQGVARIGLQAADALAYAHAKGVLHRDVKPANFLLDARGTVWVTDFGLAKAAEDDEISRTGEVVGTLRYMAPEQFRGQCDARSDVYALGLTLYELATGEAAFDATDRSHLIRKIAAAEPARPRKLQPAMPRDLETIVLKAIAREPADRYPSAADLRAMLEDRPIRARRVTAAERTWRWARRNPLVAGLATAVLALLLLVAAVSSAGYVHAQWANRRVRKALAAETQERENAEATSKLALEVLDEIYGQLAPGPTAATSRLTVEDSEGEAIDVPLEPELSPQTAALLKRLLVFYDRLAEQGGDTLQVREETAKASCRVAAIYRDLGQLDEAGAAYRRALEIYGQLDGSTGANTSHIVEIAQIHNELGNLRLAAEEPGEAAEAHRTALELLRSKAAAVASLSDQVRYETARTYYYLATADRAEPLPGAEPGPPRPAPPGSRGPGPPGIEGRPAGPELHPPGPGMRRPDDQRGPPQGPPRPGAFPPGPAARERRPAGPLAGPPRERGGLGPGAGPGSDRREEYLRMAIDLLEELCRESPSVPAYRHLLARCYRDSHAGGAFDAEALARLDKATAILTELAEEFPEVPDYRYDLSEAYAAVDVRGPLPAEMVPLLLDRLESALQLSEELVADHPNVPAYAVSQVHLHHKRARLLTRAGRQDKAEAELREALDLQASLVRQFPQSASYRAWLAVLHGSLGRAMIDRGDFDEAKLEMEQMVEVLGPLADRRGELPHVRGLLNEAYHGLAHVLDRLGQRAAADEALEHSRQFAPVPGP